MPAPLLVPAVLAVAFLVLPLVGLVLRAPWGELGSRLASPGVGEALRLSLLSATLANLVSLLLCVPLVWVLARLRTIGRTLLRSLFIVSQELSPIYFGVDLIS